MTTDYAQKAFMAVRNGNLHMLDTLIRGGFFDVKTVDENGRTILDIAKEKFSSESYSIFERQINSSIAMKRNKFCSID